MEITKPAAHIGTNPDGTCSNEKCPCHEWSKQEPVLTQTAYEIARDEVLARVHAAMAEDCDCPEHQTATRHSEGIDRTVAKNIIGKMRQDQTFASLTTVRAALADVLDAGYNLGDEGQHQVAWLFFRDESEEQTELRGKFLDTVCHRILELQHSPHGMDAGL